MLVIRQHSSCQGSSPFYARTGNSTFNSTLNGSQLLGQPIKPAGAGDGIGDCILATGDDWRRRNGSPGWRNEVRGGLQGVAAIIEAGVIGRPTQNDIRSGTSDSQLRLE